MTETKAGNIDLKKVFHDWAKDAERGQTMECSKANEKCVYEGHKIVRYKFVYESNPNRATVGGFFWLDDGRCIESWTPSKDHCCKVREREEAAKQQAADK